MFEFLVLRRGRPRRSGTSMLLVARPRAAARVRIAVPSLGACRRCLLARSRPSVHGAQSGHPAQKSGRTQVYPASSESLGERCGDIDGPIPLASRLCGRGCFLRARRRQADRRVFLVLSHPCSSRCDGVARRVTSACFAILGPGVSSCRDRPSTGYFYSSPCGEHRARDLLPTALPPLSCSMI